MRTPDTTHHVPYCFPMLDRELSGGLPAVFLKEFEGNRDKVGRTLRIISTDKRTQTFEGQHAEIEGVWTPDLKMPYSTWFSHRWAMEHMDAHTAPRTDAASLESMFRMKYTAAPGTTERLIEHVDGYPMPQEQLDSFREHFNASMVSILEKASGKEGQHIVNWQDPHLFFPEVVGQHAAAMRGAGIYSTGHVHTAWSRGTHRFRDGREIMKAMSNLDVVYGHTERYLANMRADYADLAQIMPGLRSPEFRRFDLAIDVPLMDRLAGTIDTEDQLEKAMEGQNVSPAVQAFMREVLKTRGKGMHRFVNGDRADPGKGISVWIAATREFLRGKQTLGENLQEKYRFFSFHDLLGITTFHDNDLKEQYIKHLQKEYAVLAAEFPGVVHVVAGPFARKFVPFIYEDSYNVTAAIHDGSNLMAPEGIYVNHKRGKARKGIMSTGAGFGDEAVRKGFGRGAYFVEPGNVEALTEAMERTVSATEHEPARVARDIEMMVRECILKRSDSVIVTPD
jgi:hypothetical protein